jgi:hypothetical protein
MEGKVVQILCAHVNGKAVSVEIIPEMRGGE